MGLRISVAVSFIAAKILIEQLYSSITFDIAMASIEFHVGLTKNQLF